MNAPGWPGLPARWTSSSKSGVGTAFGSASRVWLTISHGVVNEIYYPRVDQACTRDFGLLVTDGRAFFSEEKRNTSHEMSTLAPGIPAYRIVNTCNEQRYRIDKEIVADPQREVILQRIRFSALTGADYKLYALLAPHLGNSGAGNTAWLGEYKGAPMLFAEREGSALALACSTPWLARTVGYVGASDGWQELSTHKHLSALYDRADNGNVALTGEIDLTSSGGACTLAVGFGRTFGEAAHRATASLQDGYDAAAEACRSEWQAWLDTLIKMKPPGRDLYFVSAQIVRTHESDHFPGGIVASLSIPWGSKKGDGALGGYHLVWPRDLVESAGALLAIGAHEDARRVLRFLSVTQEADGHWPQNMWLDGTPYWNGIQMDETGLPILLVDLAMRTGALNREQARGFWPMIKRAATYLLQNGPVTPEDRWEEDPGYSPFTLAVEVAALLAAADHAELAGEGGAARYLRETADTWNSCIERWTYAVASPLAQQYKVDGHYVRIASPEVAEAASPSADFVAIANRGEETSRDASIHMVSPDALALVRFGLRAADDPRIVDTVKVIDAMLEQDTKSGPLWHRYNGDGYGEHADGAAFDGTGIGRLWPLLTGERAHYELARGDKKEAVRLTATFSSFANAGGMLPEQVWDAADLPKRELFFGEASGSAMPLVWAHAEYLKLCRSLADGAVFDLPPQPVERYQARKVISPHALWRFNQKCVTMPFGKTLRIETRAAALVRWSSDAWQTSHDSETRATDFGVHVVDLPTESLRPGVEILFTFRWSADRWEGKDFGVRIAAEGTP